jgi:hypothetical protein
MNDLKELSGPWSGFWIQSQVRGYMRLRLSFSANQVIGGGSDCAGFFEMSGIIDPRDGTVRLTKRYPTHGVEYQGRWDGRMIAGLWRMRQPVLYGQARFVEERGEFEMWPESEETESLRDLLEENRSDALPA